MKTTVCARTSSVAPRQLNISRQSPSLVEGSDEEIFDLGLAIFQRPHPRICVVGLGREEVDFGLYAVQPCGVVTYGRPDFSLVCPERVDCRQDRAIVGLARFQRGHPSFKLLQRRHRPILSGRSEVIPVDNAGLTDAAVPADVGGAK
jgi:hypothetical protein